MDRQRDLSREFFCRGNWHGAPAEIHNAHFGSGGYFSFRKTLDRRAAYPGNRRVCFCDVGENSARRSVLTKNKRHTAGDQGREQIAESVGCEIGMTPKLRSASEIPIVSQIWSQISQEFVRCETESRAARRWFPKLSLRSVGEIVSQ